MEESPAPVLMLDIEAPVLEALAREQGWRVAHGDDALSEPEQADLALVVAADPERGRALAARQPAALLASPSSANVEAADFTLPPDLGRAALRRVLAHTQRHWQQRRENARLNDELNLTREQMEMLADVGRVLSSQMELNELLETILTEARRLAECEAGSVYLVERAGECGGEDALICKLSQNDSVSLALRELRLPLSRGSIAGYVGATGEEINIADVDQIPEDAPYRFNGEFDRRIGYRTRSMLVLPMRDHRGRVIGVLQFINRKGRGDTGVEPFDARVTGLLRAIAGQATVAIQKSSLIADIGRLFDSFVHASVKAIEQRDPTTSGHSFRVAESTLSLLRALPESGWPRFKDLSFTEEHLREVRYAALLHDFGKVAVPERVLLKAKKLPEERIELLRYRFELRKEQLRRQALEEQLALARRYQRGFDAARQRVEERLAEQIALLDEYFASILRANEPTVLTQEGELGHLRRIREEPFDPPCAGLHGADGQRSGLITDDELEALSIRRGSLTDGERRMIEAHVAHTRAFLEVLPWPPELAGVPAIAAAHHEKLDGSGYPDGLTANEIPLASRVMTVCDIFDALTAMDRPYKSAMPTEDALRVLEDEARRGMLDEDLVRIFIASRSYETAWHGANGDAPLPDTLRSPVLAPF